MHLSYHALYLFAEKFCIFFKYFTWCNLISKDTCVKLQKLFLLLLPAIPIYWYYSDPNSLAVFWSKEYSNKLVDQHIECSYKGIQTRVTVSPKKCLDKRRWVPKRGTGKRPTFWSQQSSCCRGVQEWDSNK